MISLLVVAAGAWVCRPFLDTRPQLFTFLYSILLLYLLHLFRRRGRNLLYLIPFIMLVWTQQKYLISSTVPVPAVISRRRMSLPRAS